MADRHHAHAHAHPLDPNPEPATTTTTTTAPASYSHLMDAQNQRRFFPAPQCADTQPQTQSQGQASGPVPPHNFTYERSVPLQPSLSIPAHPHPRDSYYYPPPYPDYEQDLNVNPNLHSQHHRKHSHASSHSLMRKSISSVGERVNKPAIADSNSDYRKRLSASIAKNAPPSINRGKTLLDLVKLLHVMTDSLNKLNEFTQLNSNIKNNFNVALLTSLRNSNSSDMEMRALENNYGLNDFHNHMKSIPLATIDSFQQTFQSLANSLADWQKLAANPDPLPNPPNPQPYYNYNYNYNYPNIYPSNSINNFNNFNNINSISNSSINSNTHHDFPLYQFNTHNDSQHHTQPSAPPSNSKPKVYCLHCGSTSTPEWRKGPPDARTLCNACGLFHTKLVKKIGPEKAALELKNRRDRGEENNRRIYQ